MILFLKGLLFGFVLAATVGPMWVPCFRRALSQGALAGFISGMGIAVADGLYGAVAAFGLTAISGFLLGQRFWLGLIGGVFLLYLGIKCLVAKPVLIQENRQEKPGLSKAFLSTLGLTLANPPTILGFAAIFAGLGLVSNVDYGAASLVVLGVFLGAASWWAILAAGAGWLRRPRRCRPDARHQRRFRAPDPRLRAVATGADFAVESSAVCISIQ